VPMVCGLKLLFPRRYGAHVFARRLAKADAILVESKIATARLQRLLHECQMGNLAQRIHTLPIPIPVSTLTPHPASRSKIVVIAGRLDDDQKDAELFVKVMSRFLSIRRDYQAIAIGNGYRYVKKLVKTYARDVADRIKILPRSKPGEIKNIEHDARIFICTSRGEGFPNAIAEAICRGCSIVGPANIAALSFFSGFPCASIAPNRSESNLLDALAAEANAWDMGERQPEKIAEYFSRKLAPEAIALELKRIAFS
jgi:glycosyltransferase involved in cell wall biosynthesis